jgi:predicted aldo/keto reductase-like oxidoreductase
MWKKPYGNNGKDISRDRLRRHALRQSCRPRRSAAVVRHAHAKGINYFDTAPYYCDDRSEEIMGRAFRTMPRDTFHVSTKCIEADGAKLRASLERSLTRLGVDSIDFFHIWCLLRPEQLDERRRGGAIAAAQRAKEEGLIKHLVVSSHLNGEDNAAVLDSGLFEGITIGYNAINFPFRGKTLEAAARHNLGVATMNPLGGGLIPRNAKRLAFLMGPQDKDVVQAALRFNVSQPAITCALVGFSCEREVDEAVAAVENFQPYPAEHIERVKAGIGAGSPGSALAASTACRARRGCRFRSSWIPSTRRSSRDGRRDEGPVEVALVAAGLGCRGVHRVRRLRRAVHAAPADPREAEGHRGAGVGRATLARSVPVGSAALASGATAEDVTPIGGSPFSRRPPQRRQRKPTAPCGCRGWKCRGRCGLLLLQRAGIAVGGGARSFSAGWPSNSVRIGFRAFAHIS